MRNLNTEIITEILHQSRENFILAQRYYRLALLITRLSLILSLLTFGAVASGKFPDQTIATATSTLPLLTCIQLLSTAHKHLASTTQQLNQVLDNLPN
ncbi:MULTISPECIES: hypothetical protein [Leptolyngbya]|uniref:hypothetical protein n=1 Tax=Leptolyngbya TaxID=47251 RepID=UPI0019989087|nr:hypothetical protein [Leptolyngbya sp. FACHB-1624]